MNPAQTPAHPENVAEKASEEVVFCDDSRFDIDLGYGQQGEQRAADLLSMTASKIEVKTDRLWKTTGNIALEVKWRGRPSGLATTKADYWIFILADGDEDFSKLIFSVKRLKRIARRFKHNFRYGGDDNQSKLILVPLAELWDSCPTS
ncbi:hypothetical protein [uncultured Mediterranean phage uvDeep-CGR2-AD3-C191]|nr:hypothetical protein [uncultured Mediterranean phage uvDeep-CGR2-AD3-C191]